MIEIEEFADGAFELQRIFGIAGERRGAALCTPYSSITALATSLISGSEERPR
jgi:hypothetical protein